MNKKAIIEALMELGRTAVLSAIPVIILSLESWSIDWRVLIACTAIPVLRAVDKLLHVQGKETENESLTKGLTRF